VLKSISYTFDNLIRPDPSAPLAVSYSLTVSNMLRQLLLTMQHEERAISEDTVELRAALSQAEDLLERADAKDAVAAEIRQALDRRYSGPEPAHWARENWRTLRGVLERTIVHLQALRSQFGSKDDYRATRQALRDYLDRSLNREKVLIDGAFTLARR
jgi:hypothetical protein